MHTAVTYLRVSTKVQATRGNEAEGFSIPAQRDACQKKAAAMKRDGRWRVRRCGRVRQVGRSPRAETHAGLSRAKSHHLRDRPQDQPSGPQPCWSASISTIRDGLEHDLGQYAEHGQVELRRIKQRIDDVNRQRQAVGRPCHGRCCHPRHRQDRTILTCEATISTPTSAEEFC